MVPLFPAGDHSSPILVKSPGGKPAWRLDRGTGERCALLSPSPKLNSEYAMITGALAVHRLQARVPGGQRLLASLVSGITIHDRQYLVHRGTDPSLSLNVVHDLLSDHDKTHAYASLCVSSYKE